MNGDEGGQLSDFIGGGTVLMRGDIRLIGGIPPVPPTRENPASVLLCMLKERALISHCICQAHGRLWRDPNSATKNNL